MTQRADFSADEWELLTTTVESVGFEMLMVARSGPIGKFRELSALAFCLTSRAVPLQYKQNELVLALLEDTSEQAYAPLTFLSLHDVAHLMKILSTGHLGMLTYCEQVNDLLATKTSWTEADGMKRWLLWIASSVAEASGEGWLGLGHKVSGKQARALIQIATTLRISSLVQVPTAAQLDALLGLSAGDNEPDRKQQR